MFDVTGLPDTSRIKEVGRIRVPEAPGGATISSPTSIPTAVRCCSPRSRRPPAIHTAPTSTTWKSSWPATPTRGSSAASRSRAAGAPRGYHDAYVSVRSGQPAGPVLRGRPETRPGRQLRLRRHRPQNPKLLASSVAQASMQSGGHTFVATPDGRYGLTIMTSPAHQPMRICGPEAGAGRDAPVIRRRSASGPPMQEAAT